MARPLELWAFIFANTLLFLISMLLMSLSFIAYYQNPRVKSYKYSTIGFGFIVLGGLVDPVYRLGIRGEYYLNGTGRLLLQSSEGVLLSIGLGLLFYAIMRHDVRPSSMDGSDSMDTNIYGFDEQRDD